MIQCTRTPRSASRSPVQRTTSRILSATYAQTAFAAAADAAATPAVATCDVDEFDTAVRFDEFDTVYPFPL